MLADKLWPIITITCLALLAGCANPVPPDGGINTRKDTQAPVVLEQEPAFASTNVESKRIKIDFDEYVVLQDVFNQVLVSPPISERPDLSLRKKSLIVKLPDDLRENTTYTINFGESIKDYREGNVLQNLSFVFSTGPELDSGMISGFVKEGQSGAPPEKAIVALYLADTFEAVTSKKPYYFAFTKKDGSYSIPFIAAGNYYLFAFTDENFNYFYDLPGNEKIAFQKETISIDDNQVEAEDLLLFEEMAEPQLLEAEFRQPGLISFTFNQPISTLLINSDRFQEGDFVKVSAAKDTFYYWSMNADTGYANFVLTMNKSYTDSTRVRFKRQPGNRLDIANELGVDSLSKSGEQSVVLRFNAPIDRVDEEQIVLIDDLGEAMAFELIQPDRNSVELSWAKGLKAYELELPAGALASVYGQINKEQRLVLLDPKGKLKGDLLINFEGMPAAVNPILELVNANGKVISRKVLYAGSGRNIRIEDVPEAVYSIRIFNDADVNGIWSTGNLLDQSQPEEYIYRKGNVSVKGAWETEISIEW